MANDSNNIDHLLPPHTVATFENGAGKRAIELEVVTMARQVLNDARDISVLVHLDKADNPCAFTITGAL